MRLAGVDIGTAQRLKSQMVLHVRGGKHDAKMKGLTTQGITAMDIGSLAVPAATPAMAESNKLLAEINAMRANLASLMAGKGKGGQGAGGGSGKGPWSSYGGARTQQSKGDKGKSKGKGKASDLRPGTKFCHKFAETGRCPHLEQYGYCKFKHVRGVPKKLQNIEGIRVEDLGALTYDMAADCLVCNTESRTRTQSPSILQKMWRKSQKS